MKALHPAGPGLRFGPSLVRCCCLVLFAVLGLSLAESARGQRPPGQPIPERTAVMAEELSLALRTRIDLGLAASKAGRHAEARKHFLSALEFGPATPSVLLNLLSASVAAEDEDARLLWSIRYFAAVASERGRFKADRKLLALLPAGKPHHAELAVARAEAVAELAGFVAKRLKGRAAVGRGVMIDWATSIAFELMRDAPALQTKFGPAFRAANKAQVADYKTVLNTLIKIAAGQIKPRPEKQGQPVAPEPIDVVAMRAARCLTGMGAQATFKDRKGPKPPNVDRAIAAGKGARERIRAKLPKVGPPLTVELLRAMNPQQREQFTEEHRNWSRPGVAVSPTGKYQVHTTCGFETLLGVAESVELHHARLVNWYGKDPFKQRQGVIRVVPASEGLESEDAPFFWAGGFQSGDRTTVKFNWSSIEGLGRTLTHELTHRFDGTLFAFMPSWLTEGRAVWTGGGYAWSTSTSFVERYINRRAASNTLVDGYGRPGKLKKLIEGKIDDYRDNYTAGNALYTYLASWRVGGKKLFAARLEHFMRKARAGRNKPFHWFVNCFADGKAGRPKDFRAFAGMFHKFVDGWYQAGWDRTKRKPWMREYTTGMGQARRAAKRPQPSHMRNVLDEPTYVWNRTRAEPWFGQDHAAAAGELFAELEQPREAVAALLWSLSTDGWRVANARLLGSLLEQLRHNDIAWVVRAELRRRGDTGALARKQTVAPTLSSWPKLRAYLASLRSCAEAAHLGDLRFASRQILSWHDRVGRLVGIPTAAKPGAQDAKDPKGTPLYPSRRGAVHLGAFGWIETGLTQYEDRRRRNLWYEEANRDLHVGRSKAREDSGLLDRRASQRDAFVRSVEWFGPGDYVFKTRVHFTTSFVKGAVVFGYARRDRTVKLRFSAGDFLYSIGRKEDAGKTKGFSLSMQEGWRREGNLNRRKRAPHEFDQPKSNFDLEVRVSGPTAVVYAEGNYMFSYTTVDRAPIVGSIGFAMSQGAVRLQSPRVRRLPAGTAIGGADTLRRLIGRKLANIPPSEHGSIVVLMPTITEEEAEFVDYEDDLARAIRKLRKLLDDPLHHPQPRILLLPSKLPKAVAKALAKTAKREHFTIQEHNYGEPLTGTVYGMFIDPHGAIRVVADLFRRARGDMRRLQSWARKSRADH